MQNTSGTAVSNAVVVAIAADGTPAATGVTDANGNFLLHTLTGGSYTLEIFNQYTTAAGWNVPAAKQYRRLWGDPGTERNGRARADELRRGCAGLGRTRIRKTGFVSLKGPDMHSKERLAAARAARQSARYTEALDLIQGCEDWPAPENEDATLLRAQILARRAPIEALELLARTQDIFTTPEGIFGYYVASMRAYTGTRNFDSAAEMGVIAERLLDTVDISSKCLLWHQQRGARRLPRAV